MRSLDARDLFVFIGAGASCSPPSNLPLFDALRDEILIQLDLCSYVAGHESAEEGKVAVARALTPEPFFRGLSQAVVDITAWLDVVLESDSPNAAHRAAAALAAGGAQVWTVNFDRLLESAAETHVPVAQWPEEPSCGARILKPHGSIGGELVVQTEQVLRGLPPAWEAKLRADVAGRTVIFLGYSGRDLDFRPIWNEVVASSQRVIWFEGRAGASGAVVGEADKRRLMQSVDVRGALEFPLPELPPRGARGSAASNPSWDFVVWCSNRGLVEPDPVLARRLFDARVGVSYPPLEASPFARPVVLGLLGNYRAARRDHLRLAIRSETSREAIRRLVDTEITHAGRGLALPLRPLLQVPDRLAGRWKPRLRRKLLTVDHRCGRHARVLRRTRNLKPTDVSTLLILRASSLRIRGSLDEAALAADEGFKRARAEGHAVRTAHAAYQQCMALLWAERIDEATAVLENRLRPYSAIAANRWVAWADFVEGELAVRARDPSGATAAYDAAAMHFGAELLIDGLVSVATARLTVARLDGDDMAFGLRLGELRALRHTRDRGSVYYSRRNRFTTQAIEIERAEFARVHSRDLAESNRRYRRLARSRYPLHRAFGLLGLALVVAELREDGGLYRERARRTAADIGQRLVLQRIAALEAGHLNALAEVFFC